MTFPIWRDRRYDPERSFLPHSKRTSGGAAAAPLQHATFALSIEHHALWTGIVEFSDSRPVVLRSNRSFLRTALRLCATTIST